MPQPIDKTGYNLPRYTRLSSFKHNPKGPSVIIIGGIHGNENAGPIALKKVIDQLNKNKTKINGNFYAITGNLNALNKNIRFEHEDLNRLWTEEKIAHLEDLKVNGSAESKEQKELFKLVKDILNTDKGPFYFIDLHTTSSASQPFITISDSLENRKLSKKFKVPIILGIEEYLEGPFLTYINEFGHASLGFEAGQHKDPLAIEHCEAFIWLCLKATYCIKAKKIDDYKKHKTVLNINGGKQQFFEIKYRYLLKKDEDFIMLNGFNNFDPIKKGQILALSHQREIKAHINGRIFMPLYQKQGEDGFFIITPVSYFWLKVSALVRNLKLDQLLRLLPGIKQADDNKFTLIVNPKTARFLRVKIFHLFGYRKKIIINKHIVFIKRDRKIIKIE